MATAQRRFVAVAVAEALARAAASAAPADGEGTERPAASPPLPRAVPEDLWRACTGLVREEAEQRALLALARDEGDVAFASECERRLAGLWEDAEDALAEVVLGEASKAGGCFLEIHSGEGGTDAMDFCRMLGEMYRGWAATRGLGAEEVSAVAGEAGGLRSATMLFTGPGAFGLLAPEAGVHRLIRTSPFDRQGRRHTSFASVSVLPEGHHEADGVVKGIAKKDLKVETMRSSGPGGQSANMSETAVRVTHVPTGKSVRCQRVPSQQENLKTAIRWLSAKLEATAAAEQRRQRADALAPTREASSAAERRVRTYTLHPREMVKDHRCGLVTADAGAVLEGEALEPFLRRGVLWACLQDLGAEGLTV